MAGKLNGVIPAQTPSGCAERVDVDAGGDLVGEVALEQRAGCRRRTRRPPGRAAPRPRASESTLPCSSVIELGELVDAGVDQLAEREQHLGPRGSATTATSPRTRPAAAAHRGVDVGAARPAATSACCSPVAGFQTGAASGRRARRGLAADPVLDGPHRVVPQLSRVQVAGAGRALCGLVRPARACVRATPARDDLGHRHVPPGCAGRRRRPAGRSRRGRRWCRRRPAPRASAARSSVDRRWPGARRAPRLAALAARSTGSTSPSSRPVPASR